MSVKLNAANSGFGSGERGIDESAVKNASCDLLKRLPLPDFAAVTNEVV